MIGKDFIRRDIKEVEILKKGCSGGKAIDIQRRLRLLGYELGKAELDGIYGPDTERAVKKFQQDRSLLVTGIVDQETWQELVDAGYKIGDRLLYLKYPPFRGDDVKTLQFWLKSLGFYSYNENGIFCERTHKALLEFQRNMNIPDDGIVGEETLRHLGNLRRIIVAKKTSNFPLISSCGDKKKGEEIKIILDYGEDINDIQNNEKFFGEKIYICKSIVNYCRDLLVAGGIKTLLTVNENESQSLFLFDRISYANKSKGDILISLNLNYSSDEDANGSSCFYFKGFKSYSIAGKKLAELIQDNIISTLKIPDCMVHGANYAILKETSMVSVVIEPAFISNQYQREKLRDSEYQKTISSCISEAVLKFLKE